MNFKLKTLAAALLVVAAAPAGAAIMNTNSGDGELFLSAWDLTNQVSYTRDLGIQMSTFTGASNITSSTDANWTSFLGMVADPTALKWNVVAGDSVGSSALLRNYLSTSLASASTVGGVFNSNMGNFAVIDNYIDNVNAVDGTGLNMAANVSTIVSSATNPVGYAGNALYFSDNFGGKESIFSNAATVGQGMNFYLLQNSDSLAAHKIKVTQFGDVTNGFGTWALASNGTLAYSTPSVVPVPPALWLFGSGLMGLVGVARRKIVDA